MTKYRMLETIQLEFADAIIDVSVVYFKSDIVFILATQFSVRSQVFNDITPVYNHMEKVNFLYFVETPNGISLIMFRDISVNFSAKIRKKKKGAFLSNIHFNASK